MEIISSFFSLRIGSSPRAARLEADTGVYNANKDSLETMTNLESNEDSQRAYRDLMRRHATLDDSPMAITVFGRSLLPFHRREIPSWIRELPKPQTQTRHEIAEPSLPQLSVSEGGLVFGMSEMSYSPSLKADSSLPR